MPAPAGARSERLGRVRSLRTGKGRDEHGAFAIEGETLLREALAAGLHPAEVYATQAAYDAGPLPRKLEARGVPVFLVDERGLAKISDLDSPPGILAVLPLPPRTPARLACEGLVLVLADVGDPGNAGTLLRSAEAFGCAAVGFGSLGVDPYHPKVVRAAMGALFRLQPAVVTPAELLAVRGDRPVAGLAAGGSPLTAYAWPSSAVVVVGQERHGLGRWEAACTTQLGIPMRGSAESLNAAIAGSIALYEASKARDGA